MKRTSHQSLSRTTWGSAAAYDGEALTELPQMRDLQGMGRFLQRLRNAGLQPQLMGDFPATDDGPAAQREF